MKRIRSTIEETILHNKWNQRLSASNATEVHVELTDDGGIQEHRTTHLMALDCGHHAPFFSFCGRCERELCEACSVICEECKTPVGRGCHAVEVERRMLCTECHAAVCRSRFWRLVLSPFIRFREGKQQ